MYAKKLVLKDFRNIDSACAEFEPGINILLGDNAQGKTNAMEGIYLFSLARSFRTTREREYIRDGQKNAYLSLDFYAQNRDQRAEIGYEKGGRKKTKRNGVTVTRMSEFVGVFRSVIFCPEHLSLVKSGPADRRRFLDYAISQLDSSYLRAQQTYTRALMQRNKLLLTLDSMGKSGENMLDIWDKKLAEAGGIISKKRAEYTESVKRYACGFFSDMTSGAERPCFEYRDERDEENILRLLHSVRERDIKLRTTSAGPHKDDISITLNGREARAYASQGQQRSLAVAMKLAEAGISGERTGEKPVLLLDDVLSELDEHRKKYILTSLRDGQIIISACEKDIFGQSSGNVINVKGGTFSCI